MIDVWTDGNGFGYYAYLTEKHQGTIGKINPVFKNRGRNALRAEAEAIMVALENTRQDGLRICTDSAAVREMIDRPEIVLRPKLSLVKPVIARILDLVEARRAEMILIKRSENRAHDLLVPYRKGRYCPRLRPPRVPVRAEDWAGAEEPNDGRLEVWADGNGFGYFSYLTAEGKRGLGRLPGRPRASGKMLVMAEAQAVLSAIEENRGVPLRVDTDSQVVAQMIEKPDIAARSRNMLVRPLIERIIAGLAGRDIEVREVCSADNRAHRLLVPYGKRKYLPLSQFAGPPPGGDQ